MTFVVRRNMVWSDFLLSEIRFPFSPVSKATARYRPQLVRQCHFTYEKWGALVSKLFYPLCKNQDKIFKKRDSKKSEKTRPSWKSKIDRITFPRYPFFFLIRFSTWMSNERECDRAQYRALGWNLNRWVREEEEKEENGVLDEWIANDSNVSFVFIYDSL